MLCISTIFVSYLTDILLLCSSFIGISVKDINFNRWTYKVTLLTLLFGVPFYIYFYNYYDSSNNCTKHYTESSACEFSTLYLIFSLGYVTPFMLQYCFAASVVVALVGLAYGAEIAYRLRSV